MNNLVFVYGSLKRGFWNNDVLGNSKRLIEKAVTKGEFVLTNAGFPYMVRTDPQTDVVGPPELPVLGEVYQVTSEQVMASLDTLEGVRHGHYKRHQVEVEDVETGETQVATAYIPCDNNRTIKYPLCETATINNQLYYEWS